MIRFGFVTIGQSPRQDVLESMLPADLHDSVLECGALNGLTLTEVENLRPRSDDIPLVTRLADGAEVVISKSRLLPLLQEAVDRAISRGAGAVVILCTGAFPDLKSSVPLIFPDRILSANVDAILPTGTVGVILPHDGQMSMMRHKWETSARRFTGVTASPYSSHETLSDVANQLKGEGADLIVMDCMGFTVEMKDAVASSTGLPVILANRLVGRVIEELIGS